jgi:hypothetical protein
LSILLTELEASRNRVLSLTYGVSTTMKQAVPSAIFNLMGLPTGHTHLRTMFSCSRSFDGFHLEGMRRAYESPAYKTKKYVYILK